MHIALAGNPNCGKTTLFNRLTGSSAHVGNWAGVTVEVSEGKYEKNGISAQIVDMPGIYSLIPYSPEEKAACGFLTDHPPDVIINVTDATNPVRNLYLTSQLTELGIPVVVALNMMDEVRRMGIGMDINKLSRAFGVHMCEISAATGEGLDTLMEIAEAESKKTPNYTSLLEKTALKSYLHLKPTVYESLTNISGNGDALRILPDSDSAAGIAALRYEVLDEICGQCFSFPENQKSVDDRIDAAVTGKYTALPIFLLVTAIVFYVTFGSFGTALCEAVGCVFDSLHELILNIGPDNESVAAGLIVSAVDGVGAVVGFLPQIILLFFFISLLESSGYMARAAFLTDGILHKMGLTGKSFISLMLGFGCSVSGIMSAQTVENRQNRRLTVALVPYMSCSAKLPVYTVIAGAVFPQCKWVAVGGAYLLGILVASVSGAIAGKLTFSEADRTFLTEMPRYRLPRLRNVIRLLWDKSVQFILRASTVILSSTVLIWLMQNYDITLSRVTDSSKSMLALLGGWVAPLLSPLGFGSWQAASAVITGFIAREMIVSTLGVLYPGCSAACLFPAYPVAGALSFISLVLLLPPCTAAVSAMRRTLGSFRETAAVLLIQTAIAWTVSFLIYNLAVMAGG